MIKLFDNTWDTNFFEIKTGSIKIDEDYSSTELLSILKIASKKYKLLYVISETNDNNILGDYKKYCSYVDERIVYSKEIKEDAVLDENIHELSPDSDISRIYDLAYVCGGLSRFNMDEKLPDEKFKGLYQMMLANTFNSESDKVFIYDNDGYKGLITLKCDQNVRIGLLGVRSDSQGLGIGKSLMNAADHFSYKNGWSRVDVLTQALNYGAIELYQKCGYKMVEKSCIFHLWF